MNTRIIPWLLLAAACGSYSAPSTPPASDGGVSNVQTSLSSEASTVFVGDRTRLTAVFDGSGFIEGIGPVQSGVAVETPPLARTTTFLLRVTHGGEQEQASATVDARYRNRIRVLAAAPFAQTNHLAAALPDGRAIVMGGNTSESPLVPDSSLTQIFDPITERFTRGPDLAFSAQAQIFTSVAPLARSFLLVGTGPNTGGGRLHSVITQVFDSAAPEFTRVGDAATPGTSFRTATPLLDGGVLLTGGFGPGTVRIVNSVNRFDPAAGQWRAVRGMGELRIAHTATLLRDGRALVVGGLTCCQQPNPSPELFSLTAEIYDPSTDSFSPTGTMKRARGGHAAAMLFDGRVLITGGDGNDPDTAPLATEIFDPATGQFSSGGDLRTARDSHAAITLTEGRVLVIGGELPPQLAGSGGVGGTEIFDPATGQWSAGPALVPAFFGATVTMLTNGKILIFGGQNTDGWPQAAAALFE